MAHLVAPGTLEKGGVSLATHLVDRHPSASPDKCWDALTPCMLEAASGIDAAADVGNSLG